MATIQEQLENAVAIYNKCAGKVNKFINGGDTETIESESGNKPTLAKIAKDAKDTVDSSIISLTEKAKQVANDKNEILQIKDDVEQTKIELDIISKRSAIPIGIVCWFPSTILPDGYLRCNGSEITKEMFPDLCKVLNNGDETALIATLPESKTSDGRGLFIRDIGNNETPLVVSEDSLKAHNHIQGIPLSDNLGQGAEFGYIKRGANRRSSQYGSPSQRNALPYTSTTGNDETKPANITFVMCIKAFHGAVKTDHIDAIVLATKVQENKSKIDTINTEIILWESPTGQTTGSISLNGSMENYVSIRIDIINTEISSGVMPLTFNYNTRVSDISAISGRKDNEFSAIAVKYVSNKSIQIIENLSNRCKIRKITGIK